MAQNGRRDGHNEHAIEISEESQPLLDSKNGKLSVMPMLLRESAGLDSCCVFRVLQSLVLPDQYVYQPHIISIGPYHHGKDHLKITQEHKWRFLHKLLSRNESAAAGITLIDYLNNVRELESRARQCYSEEILYDSDKFVEMMVLDGCFIIELFRVLCANEEEDLNDPIFSVVWMRPLILRDFVKLENQIPFFVLQSLFDLSTRGGGQENDPSLTTLALKSFNTMGDRDDDYLESYQAAAGVKHLLDLLRSSFIPPPVPSSESRLNLCFFIPWTAAAPRVSTRMIECVSKHRRAGIEFEVKNDPSFLNVTYRNGVIQMPKVSMDDFTVCFLLNCVSFEQCYMHREKHFTTYACFMDCLTNTNKDVDVLCDAGIIENLLSTNEDVALFFNTLGKDIGFDINHCYLGKLFDDVDRHYRDQGKGWWAGFQDTYFNTAWWFISNFTAFVLLLFTVASTVNAIYPYYPPA